ncbi:MAG: CBM9 [uncultured Pyrinomonadaceae bacterium]|uniref:CBM9 n=1 Tax=uncultured Pyrinomonadaceae bacterium TaxID=2283094 RepID=A0A6J4NW72_9BACT|nr:MAG: CBM9 [uncultured Pyrinomonadaceae bacterium]
MEKFSSINIKSPAALLLVIYLSAVCVMAQAPTSTTKVTEAEPSPSASPVVPVPQTEPQTAVVETSVEPTVPAPRYMVKDAPARIPRLETPPVIDGQLNDAVWKNAAVFGEFFQTNPGDNVKPTHPTETMIGYDAKNLYIAFRVIQDRDKVRATVARRDNIFNDDYVLLYLDTFNDQRQAYVVFFNPLGIQADGTYTEGRGEDYSVDLLMESKGVLTDDGFTIEAAIPFKSLRYEAGKNKQWGIHIFRRVKYNNNEYNSWMPNNRSISGSLNQAGHITGLEDISTTRQLEINPSFTVSEAGRRTRFSFNDDPAGRYVNDRIRGEFGMTAKFSLTPTITLDFAYNPDFAQVEADAPVTSANQRFPIFFSEKRPFFLERIDIFNTRMNVVNTRAIVDPDIALKLTGRRGKNTFGVLYASDNAPGNYSLDEREGLSNCQQRRITNPSLLCNGIERFVDRNADIGIIRLKRDVGRQHSLGFFATTYNFTERHNNTAGFDGRFRLSPKIVTEFQVLGTHSRRCFFDQRFEPTLNPQQAARNREICGTNPNNQTNSNPATFNQYRTGNGFGYSYSIERSDRNLFFTFNGVGRTRDYRADVGFTPRVDTNQHRSFIQYQTDRDAKKKIIFKRISNDAVISHNWLGQTQNWQSNTQGMLAFQRQTFVGGGVEFGYERVFESEFGLIRSATRRGAFFGDDSERSAHKRELYGFIETAPNKQIFALFVLSHTWGQLDYDLGGGPDYPRVSRAALLNPNNPLDPGAGNQLYIESVFRYQPTSAWQAQLNYNKVRLTRYDTGRTAFDDNIFSLRSTYQFTRDIFARLRLDYSTLSTRLRPQLVVGWTPSPGTALYAGYNDDLNYNGYNPYNGQFEPGFRGNGRTFFIKASYLFRKSF